MYKLCVELHNSQKTHLRWPNSDFKVTNFSQLRTFHSYKHLHSQEFGAICCSTNSGVGSCEVLESKKTKQNKKQPFRTS